MMMTMAAVMQISAVQYSTCPVRWIRRRQLDAFRAVTDARTLMPTKEVVS